MGGGEEGTAVHDWRVQRGGGEAAIAAVLRQMTNGILNHSMLPSGRVVPELQEGSRPLQPLSWPSQGPKAGTGAMSSKTCIG